MITNLDSKVNYLVKRIKKESQRPIENEGLLRKYIFESLKGRPITFYNWECPPRILKQDQLGSFYLDYCVDLDKIFRGEKLDYYTELPRVVEAQEKEKKILKFLNNLDLNFRFVKIVADTNAYYITPFSLKALGETKVKKTFLQFQEKIKKATGSYPVKSKVYLFTDLMGGYQKNYKSSFKKASRALESNISGLVPEKIWQEQLKYIKEHIGFEPFQKKQIEEFSKRTIATYAAEGTIFDLLSRTDYFSNCVWLNIEEVAKRAITITNCLRIKQNLGKLPMIFLK